MPDLHDLSRRLRRLYLRRRRLVSAALAAGAALTAVHVVSPPPAQTQAMVVATHDLPGGTVLAAADVRRVEGDPDLVPAGVARSESELLGQVVAAPMRTGEAVTDRRLVGSALIEGYGTGLVAAPVRLQDEDVVSLLHVGDRIDVYAADGDVSAPARLVGSDAPVVMLPVTDNDLARDGALVVLAVTTDAAARLAQAGATEQLSVTLRG